jgi:hypothetical protein
VASLFDPGDLAERRYDRIRDRARRIKAAAFALEREESPPRLPDPLR